MYKKQEVYREIDAGRLGIYKFASKGSNYGIVLRRPENIMSDILQVRK